VPYERRCQAPRGGKIARRTFLAAAGVVGGGLLVGAGALAWRLKSIDTYWLLAGEGEASFGAWLRFARDGKIEVVVPHQDMGQGIYALAALLAAEGLKVAPEAVRAVPAPVEPHYANPVLLLDGLPIDDAAPSALQCATLWTFDKILRALGLQATGGSTSTRNIAQPIRLASASALDMLARAAAARFGANVDALKIADGMIAAPDGRRASYGELAEAASKLAPREIAVPPLADGAFVGKGAPRFDVPPKVRGLARYGIDTREAGQLYAAIRHSPRIGGRLALATMPSDAPGVRGMVQGKDYVAVVADSYAAAMASLDRVDASWDDSHALNISTRDVFAAYRAALDKGAGYKPRWVIDAAGDLARAAGKAVKATYDAPFLAHATMEPMNATALVAESGVTVWAGHQSASLVRLLAADAASVASDKIKVVTPWLGGGFGRRFDLDYVVKAVEIASQFKGKPVQTIWSRAEDIRDDVFRPAAMADVSATLGAGGLPTGFLYRIATPSVSDQYLARAMPSVKGGGLIADRTTVDGALFPFYGLGSRSIENFTVDTGIPVGFWRSVGFSLNCFFVESFIDELAVAAGAARGGDPRADAGLRPGVAACRWGRREGRARLRLDRVLPFLRRAGCRCRRLRRHYPRPEGARSRRLRLRHRPAERDGAGAQRDQFRPQRRALRQGRFRPGPGGADQFRRLSGADARHRARDQRRDLQFRRRDRRGRRDRYAGDRPRCGECDLRRHRHAAALPAIDACERVSRPGR
jgi:isoquinoline 1-oxidoreductase beta subunit